MKTRLHRARRQLQDALSTRLLAASPSLFEFQGERCDRVVAGVLARLDRPTMAGTQPGCLVIPALKPARARTAWLARFLALFSPRRLR